MKIASPGRGVALQFLLVLIVSTQCFAQFPDALDNLRNVMPPSPNSSAFAQYGNWPVNLFTGVPSISVPVTTVKGRTTSIPISLSYHAAGNHVGDVASWVGLGWSLNAGGVITRSVKGLNDEAGFFAYSSYYANPNDLSSTVPTNIGSPRVVATANNLTDSEQDSYSFSALGKSYRLLLMADGSVYTIPTSNIKVVANPIVGSDPAGGWTVIMEDGTNLLFGATAAFQETTTNINYHSSDGGGISFTSSWQLQTLTTTSGETINFTYVSSVVEQDSYFSQSDNIKYRTDTGDPSLDNCAELTQSLATGSHPAVQSATMLYPVKIESDLERVVFKTTSGRQDLYGGLALSEIKVFSKITGKLTEDYVFNASYSQAVTSTELLTGTSNTSYFYYRLRLNSMVKKDTLNSSASQQTWSFSYNPQNLPSRRSFAQDHWGFFNGATANNSILPRLYFQLPNIPNLALYLPTTGFMPGYHDWGGVRYGNPAYMQAEMLTAIHYPTGGYSQFTYEPNQMPTSRETFTDTNINLNMNLTSTSGAGDNTQTSSFTLTTPGYVSITLSANISPSVLADQPTCQVTSVIKDASNNIVGMLGSSGATWFNIRNAGTYTITQSVNTMASNLSVGDYVISTTTLGYPHSNGVHNFNQLTGGLRIVSIIDYDDVSNTATDAKYYQYASPMVINAIDSVNDYMTSQNSLTKTTIGDGEYAMTFFCYFTNVVRNSSTKYAAGSIQGGTTGYGQVTTLFGVNGANGSTVSVFNTDPDASPSDPHAFPYPSPDSRDVHRGLLLTEKTYNAVPILLKQVDKSYSFTTINSVTGFKVGFAYLDGNCQDIYGNCGTTVGYESTTAEQVKHLTEKQTVYDQNGQNALSTKKTFYYDNVANTQPIRTVTYTSIGDSITVYSRTPLELAAIKSLTPMSPTDTSAIYAMKQQNMVSEVIQRVKYDNSSLVGIETVHYGKWGTANILLPQSEVLQTATNTPSTTVVINNYDTYGNPLQLTPIDGVTKNYIWDYLSAHPIAEIKNARTYPFAYTSFEADGSGNWTISSSSRTTTTGFTGTQSYPLASNSLTITNLSASQSFIISLWASSGSTINFNGTAVAASDSRKGWSYYQKTMTGVTSVVITGTGNVDEARAYPAGALMTTYTYGDFGPLTMTNTGNQTTFYEYDGLGRLCTVRDDNNKVLKAYRYNYQNHTSNPQQ